VTGPDRIRSRSEISAFFSLTALTAAKRMVRRFALPRWVSASKDSSQSPGGRR